MGELKRLNRELVRAGAILDIFDDTMQLPDGSIEHWDMVHHRMGAACTVAVTPENKIVLCRQQRPALERYTWELPAGSRDDVNEDMEVCARRELTEETGYSSDDWMRLLSLRSTVAFCDERIDVYLARNVVKTTTQSLDPAEEISVCEFDLTELLDKIYSGEIQDSKTVSGILAFAALDTIKGRISG